MSSISRLRLSTSASVKSRVIDPGLSSALSAQCIFCPNPTHFSFHFKDISQLFSFLIPFRRENSNPAKDIKK